MTRHLLNLLTALSFAALIVASLLWALDVSRGGVSRRVLWDNRRWDLAAPGGRFWLDAEPQRRWEELRYGQKVRRLNAERERYVDLKIKVRQDAKAGRIADPKPLLDDLNAEQRKVIDELDTMNKTLPVMPSYSVPAAPVVAALAVLPVFNGWAILRRTRDRRRRRRLGRCTACGYDLTANTSGVCPECGTRVPRING